MSSGELVNPLKRLKPGSFKINKSGKVVQFSSQIAIIEQSKNKNLKEVLRYPLGLVRWFIA